MRVPTLRVCQADGAAFDLALKIYM